MKAVKIECKRCGRRATYEEMEHNDVYEARICKDRELCTIRVLMYVVTGVR